jgi:flagellar biosynthesis protein FliQ
VPKILAIFATMLVALPFMGDLMAGIMGRIMSKVVLGG